MAIVRYLVEKGCHVNHLDMQNDSPLHIAIEVEQVLFFNKGEVAKYLIEEGADINAKNKSGKTPIQMTANQAILNYLK
jgi:ankyrin repeat protein